MSKGDRTSRPEIVGVATIWARHGPECRSINPASIEICHVAENRRGISRENEGDGAAGRGAREQDGHRVSMERDDAVGGPRRLRVNTKAPRRFTTPPDRAPCLTYPRLSGTNHFHCLLGATTRASNRACTSRPSPERRDAFRKLLSRQPRSNRRRGALKTTGFRGFLRSSGRVRATGPFIAT